MSRPPVNEIAKKKKPFGQDGVWVQIRKLQIFTTQEIKEATKIDGKTISDYIKRLEAGGFVEEHVTFEESQRYHLVRDAGVHAPRLKPNGEAVTQGMGNTNMWRSMRMLKTFTTRDLATHSTTELVEVKEKTVKAYVRMLLKAGYLRVERKAVISKHQAVYKFVRNTGPQPPQIQNVKQVFDPNIQEVTYYPEVTQ
jgi:Mn-dependent DtxR family transcriptional regulator